MIVANTNTAHEVCGAKDGYGWHVVLNANFSIRMLCVDFASPGAGGFFRQLGADVFDLSASDNRTGGEQVSAAGMLCRALESNASKSDGELGIDAFVLHDLNGMILGSDDSPELFRMFRAVYRLLKPGGYCYIGFRNANAIFERLRGNLPARGMLRPGKVRKYLARAGFNLDLMRVYPYLLDGDCVVEVLPDRGYVSVKDSTLWRERAKEWCYGAYGAARFAPAYGLVAYKHGMGPSVVDSLAQRLKEMPGSGSEHLLLMRCQLALGRKVFFSYGSGGSRYGRFVVIYTRDIQSISRREVEAQVLGRMAGLVPEIQQKLPHVITSGEIIGHRYFVLSELPGITIDRVCPGSRIAMRNAAFFLAKMHRITATEYVVSPEVFEDLVGGLCRQAVERYKWLEADIRLLTEAIRLRAIGRRWPRVWQHGDYKLENVILDKRDLSVVGVIDWEHSRELGLPLLDMLYLIAYARGIEPGSSYEDAYCKMVLPWRFSDEERLLLDWYQAEVGFMIDDPTMWAAIFFVHDIGIRRLYDISLSASRDVLEGNLRATLNAITSSAKPACKRIDYYIREGGG